MSIQLGQTAPDFSANTTNGTINFHEFIGNSWCVLFSHPKDYTPVCTTELGYMSTIQDQFKQRNVKTIALSVDSVDSHNGWINDINETQNTTVTYPIIADEDRAVSNLYNMIHPDSLDSLTVRTVFVIDPNKKIRLMITYPASTGRNFDEILRVIDSLQLTDNHSVATPVNWVQGDKCVIVPSITEEAELNEKFPAGYEVVKPYLRLTPQPNLKSNEAN